MSGILAVAVQGGDPGAAGMLDAGDDASALPAARFVADDAQRCALGKRLPQALRGLIRAAVVDIDDLMRNSEEGGADLADERQDVGSLVAHRHDDRDQRLPAVRRQQ
jgi:hypothetical protein